jgi:hypothetical protein
VSQYHVNVNVNVDVVVNGHFGDGRPPGGGANFVPFALPLEARCSSSKSTSTFRFTFTWVGESSGPDVR